MSWSSWNDLNHVLKRRQAMFTYLSTYPVGQPAKAYMYCGTGLVNHSRDRGQHRPVPPWPAWRRVRCCTGRDGTTCFPSLHVYTSQQNYNMFQKNTMHLKFSVSSTNFTILFSGDSDSEPPMQLLLLFFKASMIHIFVRIELVFSPSTTAFSSDL